MKKQIFAVLLLVGILLSACSSNQNIETTAGYISTSSRSPARPQAVDFDSMEAAMEYIISPEVENEYPDSEDKEAYENMKAFFISEGFLYRIRSNLENVTHDTSLCYLFLCPSHTDGESTVQYNFDYKTDKVNIDFQVYISHAAYAFIEAGDVEQLGTAKAYIEYRKKRDPDSVIIPYLSDQNIVENPTHPTIKTVHIHYRSKQLSLGTMLNDSYYIVVTSLMEDTDANRAKALEFFNSLTFEKIPIPEPEPSEPTDSTETAPTE